jgi:PAS domain S-box-containing protein
MNQVGEFFAKLFDSSSWPPRWHCGQWTAFHGWLYIISDLLIWSAYFSIPVFILRYISKKQDVRFVRLYFLFAAFILACGATHLLDAIAFWIPVYRLNALVRFITGVISWVTVFYLIKYLPVLFSLRSEKMLEAEIEQRKKAEEKFKGLLEAAPDAMVIANEKGVITLVNRQTEKLFGYDKEELIGNAVEILIPGEFHNKHVAERTKYFADPKVRSMGVGLELFAIRKDGTKFPVEISLSPLVTEEGTLISASVRDITMRKKTEERIRFLAAIAGNIQDPVIASDNGMKITDWNEAAENLFSWKNEEVIGKAANEILNIDYPNETRDQILESLIEKDFWHGELVCYTKSGKKIDVLATVSHLKYETGNIAGNLVVLRDITQRKKAEAALARLNAELEKRVKERTEEIYNNEKQFRNTLENMLEGIQIIGFDWKYIYVNDAMAKHGKYAKEELIGHTVMEKYPGIEQTEIFKMYQRCFNERVPIHLENEFTFPDSTKGWFELSFQPVPEGLSILSVDITDRKMAEKKIANLNRELEERVIKRTEQLKKSNEELEAFSYSVSHDLRAPLRGIIGFTNILEEDYTSKLDDEAKRITRVIKNNTTRMGRLIDDLLEFSRLGRKDISKTNIDTNKMVEDVLADHATNAHNKKLKWIIHSLPNSLADINTLQQVWVNLISNAVKYSQNADEPEIEIGSIEEDHNNVFFVRDNGVGFDEKYKAKLFKVFQRLHTSDQFEGTGIGLAIVEKIISKHGGNVWAEAEINKGACFYFSLPTDKN